MRHDLCRLLVAVLGLHKLWRTPAAAFGLHQLMDMLHNSTQTLLCCTSGLPGPLPGP